MRRRLPQQLERRRVLSAMVAVAGLSALPSGALEVSAGGDKTALERLPGSVPRRVTLMPNDDGFLPRGQYSPFDGLLTNYVTGTLAANLGSSLIVTVPDFPAAPALVDTIQVLLTPESNIHARGVDTVGTARECAVGDALDIATNTTADGTRYARWMVANMIMGKAEISAVDSSADTVSATFLDAQLSPTGPALTAKFLPATWTGSWPMPVGPGQLDGLQTGQLFQFFGCQDLTVLPDVYAWLLRCAPIYLVPSAT